MVDDRAVVWGWWGRRRDGRVEREREGGGGWGVCVVGQVDSCSGIDARRWGSRVDDRQDRPGPVGGSIYCGARPNDSLRYADRTPKKKTQDMHVSRRERYRILPPPSPGRTHFTCTA